MAELGVNVDGRMRGDNRQTNPAGSCRLDAHREHTFCKYIKRRGPLGLQIAVIYDV